MAELTWWGCILVLGTLGTAALAVGGLQLYYRHRFLDLIVRIFEEKPLFIIRRGKPVAGAEDVHFETEGGFTLRGCYLSAKGSRKGVVLFAPEFGANRWGCAAYCTRLVDSGYDVFAFEPRNQGESDVDPSYSPLHWVTDRDLADLRAALTYLKRRKDAPAEGVGLFGISKGGSTSLLLAAEDAWVRCVVTDGAYGTYTTMIPFMRRWVGIYIKSAETLRQRLVPDWFYGWIGTTAMNRVAKRRGVRFLSVERSLRKLTQPLQMVHGGGDTYIRPTMAESLFARAVSDEKNLWLVPKAKHNQALQLAGAEYTRRLSEFFDAHLLPPEPVSAVVSVPGMAPVLTGQLAAVGAE